MYYYPLIRVGRMCSSVAIYPQNPLLAVSISEVLSVGLPLLNNKNYSIIIAVVMAFFYNPYMTFVYLIEKEKVLSIYNQMEIYSILIFLSLYYLYYIGGLPL